jgi:hypothetical protein
MSRKRHNSPTSVAVKQRPASSLWKALWTSLWTHVCPWTWSYSWTDIVLRLTGLDIKAIPPPATLFSPYGIVHAVVGLMYWWYYTVVFTNIFRMLYTIYIRTPLAFARFAKSQITRALLVAYRKSSRIQLLYEHVNSLIVELQHIEKNRIDTNWRTAYLEAFTNCVEVCIIFDAAAFALLVLTRRAIILTLALLSLPSHCITSYHIASHRIASHHIARLRTALKSC